MSDPTDTQLIDWLDSKSAHPMRWKCSIGYGSSGDLIFVGSSKRPGGSSEPDIRSAIIAAMQREEATR